MAETGRRVALDPQPTLAELESSWQSCDAETTVFECTIGGLSLRVEGRGELLERLAPALAHHPPAPGDPDLTLRVWDLSVARHRPSLSAQVFQCHGDDDLGHDHEIRLRYDWPQRAVQAWDSGSGIAYWVAEDPTAIEWWEEAAPFRPVLAWWLTANGRYFAHGAALAIDGRAVLLVGPGGSGKSTTALRAHRAGLEFLGDDYCLVSESATDPDGRAGSGYAVASLYRTVKLRPVDGPAFEATLTTNEHGRKIVLGLEPDDDRLLEEAELLGVASVSVHDGPCTIEDGSPGVVLRALAPTTFAQLPGVAARSLGAFGTMLRALPTAVVHLGPDADEVIDTVRTLIRSWS